MYFVPDHRTFAIIKAAADPWLADAVEPQLAEWIESSRRYRSDAAALLNVQEEIAVQINAFGQARREHRAELKDGTPGGQREIELQKVMMQARRGIRILRDVGDGMAWRALGYQRQALRQLADKNQTGGVELESATAEFAAARAHADSTGRIVVMSDITNVLRYGDFIAVDAEDEGVEVCEIKSGSSRSQSSRAPRQRKNLARKIEVLNAKEGIVYGIQRGRLVTTLTMARTSVGVVADLLRESRERGEIHERLSDSLAIDIKWPRTLVERSDRAPQLHDPFHQSPNVTRQSSLDLFDVIPRNIAPYSVFPFDVRDRAAILTGSAIIFTFCNLDNVMRALRRRGLDASLPNPAHITRDDPHSAAILVRAAGGLHQLSFVLLLPIIFEFLDEESLADQLVELLDSSPSEEYVLPAFANESALWD
jgi:hypothetical protein